MDISSAPLFVETSAFLRVLFQQDDWREILQLMESAPRIVVSRLLRVESCRSLKRLELLQPNSELLVSDITRRLREILSNFEILEISREVCTRAERIFPNNNLRSLDAIHLASFLFLREQIADLKMVSRDVRILGCIGDGV